jgi:hypothetical protein
LLAACATRTQSARPVETSTAAPRRALPANVAFVEADRFTDAGNNPWSSPPRERVAVEQGSLVEAAIADLPEFPPNPFSGCHARAELTFRALERQLPGKTFKAWIFAGPLLSPAIGGGVSYTTASGVTTSWAYHVAAAYRDADGTTMIVDTLVSRTAITLVDWVASFRIDGLAVVTEAVGTSYLFNKTEVPAIDPVSYPDGFRVGFMTRNVFSGNMYGYQGAAAETHDGARDLAADAVIAELLEGGFPGCAWAALVPDALAVKAAASTAQAPAACVDARALFDREVQRWIDRGL